jgi:PAS domain-containing protein
MPRTSRPRVYRYGMVALTLAIALLLRVALWPLIGPELPFLVLWPAVMICAWYGGLGPGLLATVLSALAADFFLLEQRFSFAVTDPHGIFGMTLFVALGVSLNAFGERLRRALRQVEQQAQEIWNRRELLHVTLSSIGDGVVTTDNDGRITFLNPIAESLTGWKVEAAAGLPLEQVFVIRNEQTREPIANPVRKQG